ncbi:cohesin domain-containing protein [Halobiforma nitratireducens]|uniref:Cohesin domain-containing protein n=1 Tax=Halobiforma nitratireducens JCM 10879 TaxID=1227454 RepID=M0M286_9EURY|nr:cohesin domain-containing protein [Halobiforma nitratireducens]EMA38714.1 hypothetical protein C446_09328 [Halobiforma nitratireducens JCM 10879]
MRPESNRGAAAVLVALCCLAIATGTLAAPVAAGDNIAIFALEPDELEAEAGETVEIDLVVSTHGDYVGDGIDELSATLSYDPEVFAVANVTHDEMLAHGDPDAEVVGSATVDDGNGSVTIDQEREPSGDGATTTERAATVTLEVAPDAPTANETIEVADASAILVSDYPQGTIERDGTISVEAVDGLESGTDGESSSVTDAVPGFGPLGVVLAALLFAAGLARQTGVGDNRE